MISWTVTTHVIQQRPTLTASGAELDRATAIAAAADALRSALMDARALVDDAGSGPGYTITIDDDPVFTLGTGGTRSGDLDLDAALDAIEHFDGTAPPHELFA